MGFPLFIGVMPINLSAPAFLAANVVQMSLAIQILRDRLAGGTTVKAPVSRSGTNCVHDSQVRVQVRFQTKA